MTPSTVLSGLREHTLTPFFVLAAATFAVATTAAAVYLPTLGTATFTLIAALIHATVVTKVALAGNSSPAEETESGIFAQAALLPALEVEIARSRRFNHEFALVMASVDEISRKFDYRRPEERAAAAAATARLLRTTRYNVDKVYRFGESTFAILLPESGPEAVEGMVRRVRRLARMAKPGDHARPGPLPLFFGATFFPSCANDSHKLLDRASLSLGLAAKSAERLHLDGAEVPRPAPETLRKTG